MISQLYLVMLVLQFNLIRPIVDREISQEMWITFIRRFLTFKIGSIICTKSAEIQYAKYCLGNRATNLDLQKNLRNILHIWSQLPLFRLSLLSRANEPAPGPFRAFLT